jgi:chromatin remodeling complex protein RSC6
MKFVHSTQNKITLDDRETYECLFKEYWGIVKEREGLTDDDVSAALPNYRKGKDLELHKIHSEGEEEEKQNDTNNIEEYTGMHKLKKHNRYSSMEFVGWASRPLSSFLASIGRYKTEPMMRWGIRSLINEYIKEKNLYHPKDKKKFLPDDKLFPIFKKKVVLKSQIYSLLEFHIAKNSGDSSGKENHDEKTNCSTDKDIDDQTCLESQLSSLIGQPLLRKGDICIKPGCFASINANNIKLIYLKRSLVFELSKKPESFVSKVVGTFVRARVDSNDHKLRNSYQLVRVIGIINCI